MKAVSISILFLALFFASTAPAARKAKKAVAKPVPAETVESLAKRAAQFVPVVVSTDVSHLKEKDRQALSKIIEASRLFDVAYRTQVWKGDQELETKLKEDTSPLGKAIYDAYQLNGGPWFRLEPMSAFVPGVPKKKPLTGGFYPEDMTKEEFTKWVGTLTTAEQEKARGYFTCIVRDEKRKLKTVPYSEYYKEYLEPAAVLLDQAAELTSIESLRKYLRTRANAFRTNDYFESDVAWMELDSVIEPTIGPYEVYEDGLFGYKAAFQAFIGIRNDAETEKLKNIGKYLQEIENHLPLAEVYRNTNLGAMSPIRVVDAIFTSGDARRGVMTVAFNLPNDERVLREKGSKRTMLKNFQEAKFQEILVPISQRLLSPEDQAKVNFNAFFTHILTHELMHGLGPHDIKVNDVSTTVRNELKELASGLEEAKADAMGLFALHYLIDKGVLDKGLEDTMYVTYLASNFRAVRFGIEQAHGKANSLVFNYLMREKGYEYDKKAQIFRVNEGKIRASVRRLTAEILSIQAEGSYKRAKAMYAKYLKPQAAMVAALKKLSDIPVDIRTIYPIAGETESER